MKQLPYLFMRFTKKRTPPTKRDKREHKYSRSVSFQANILTFQIQPQKPLTIVTRKATEIQLAMKGKVAEGQELSGKLQLAFTLVIFKNKPLILKFTVSPPLQAPSGQ